MNLKLEAEEVNVVGVYPPQAGRQLEKKEEFFKVSPGEREWWVEQTSLDNRRDEEVLGRYGADKKNGRSLGWLWKSRRVSK